MALTKKEKNFILKNYLDLSIKDISKILKLSEKDVSDFLSKQVNKKETSFVKVNDSVIGDFEFKSLKDVIFDNFYFWLGISLLIILLFYRSFDSILLSDEMSMFNQFSSGGWKPIYLIYGSMVNQYLAYVFFGLNPFGYRLIALILHIVNIILFFYLFRNFISERVLKIAVIIISIHSLFVEPMTWVAANPYVYHAFVHIIVMIFSFLYERSSKILYLLLYYFFVINFTIQGSHTNFIPIFAIIFNLFILKRSFKKELLLSFWLLTLIPVYTYLNKAGVEARVASLTTGPFFEKYIQTLPFTVAKSAELVFFPYNLALFHEETLNPGYYNFARLLTLIFIFGGIYLFFKKKFYFGLLGIACASCLYIFSPVQISWFVAERYMYFSVFIACLILALLFNYLNQRVPHLGTLLTTIYFFFFLYVSFNRFDAWASPERLWEENIKIAPDSYRVRNNLAESYTRQSRFSEASVQLYAATLINPNFAQAYFNLANNYIFQNKFSEAAVNLIKTIQLDPSVVEAYIKLAIIYANSSNFKEAYNYIDMVLKIDPNLEAAQNLKQQIKQYEIKQKN